MTAAGETYCLDANVLIHGWQDYYSPKLCPEYWDVLNQLGDRGTIFIPAMVQEEIVRTDDDLSHWLQGSRIPVHQIDGPVTECLQTIYSKNPVHRLLVDNTRYRSLADPWVIAHAIHENAVVVTKEENITAANSSKIKIPNVCENMGVQCINDFQMLGRLGIRFTCLLS